MHKLFEVQTWELSQDSICIILIQDNQPKMLTIKRPLYEKWLEVMDRLWYEDRATQQPWKCALDEYWRTAHPSLIRQDLYEYTVTFHFIKDGNIRLPQLTAEQKQQQRVKYLCGQLLDMMSNAANLLQVMEESTPAQQHNYVCRLPDIAQDIKSMSLQLVAAARNNAVSLDMKVHANGSFNFFNPESE